jgi:hypothetical protein
MNTNPTLDSLKAPLFAPAAGGGQAVTLFGSNLGGITSVTVGNAKAFPTATANDSITFKWPANLASATAYDITATALPNPKFNVVAQVSTNTIRRGVYYLPALVTNAWYANEFFVAAVTLSNGVIVPAKWTDLIGGIAASGLSGPTFVPKWSNRGGALLFNGAQFLQNVSQPVAAQPGAVFVVGQIDALPTQVYVSGGSAGTSWTVYQDAAHRPTITAGTSLTDVTDHLGNPSTFEAVFNGVASAISVNDGAKTTGNAGADNFTGITFGALYDGATDFLTNGYKSLVLLYNGIPSPTDEALINGILTNVYAPVTATLVYTTSAVPPVTQAQLHAAMAAVDLQLDGIQSITGCTLVSDTTVNAGSTVQRTIVFTLTALFQSNFAAPDLASALITGAWATPFNNLYKHTLGAVLGSDVISSPVAIAQSF